MQKTGVYIGYQAATECSPCSRIQSMANTVAFHKSGAVAHVPGMSGTCAGADIREVPGGTPVGQFMSRIHVMTY